jgi:restriction endonuclease S subunit
MPEPKSNGSNFFSSGLRPKVDQLMNILWAGGVNNPMDSIEQCSYLLFLRLLSERDEQAALVEKNYQRISEEYDHEGDGIVVSAVGARCGKCFLAEGKWRAIANTHVLLPRKEKVVTRFLWYLINDENFWVKGGTAQPFVKIADSLRNPIPLPSLPEQERLVQILDEVGALRGLRTQADQKTESVLASCYDAQFGNPLANPKRWPTRKLMEICFPRQWPTVSDAELTESGYPVYGANGLIGFYHSFNHEKPTVLITCRGATCGTINVCGPKSYVTGNAMALDNPDESVIIREFLEWTLRVRGMGDTITGAAQPQITRKNLEGVMIPTPPLDEQRTFAARVAEIRTMETAQADSRKWLDALFQSLRQRAFQGEL